MDRFLASAVPPPGPCRLKGSFQASHQWSTIPFCLPQMSQLKVSVQVNGGTPFLSWTFLMKVAYIRVGRNPRFFAPKGPKTPIFHRRTGVSLSFAQPSTGVPQTFCDSFIFQQQSWARMNRQTCGKTKFLGCIYTIDDYYGCPRFSRVPPR